jgi:hypothetical protein
MNLEFKLILNFQIIGVNKPTEKGKFGIQRRGAATFHPITVCHLAF